MIVNSNKSERQYSFMKVRKGTVKVLSDRVWEILGEVTFSLDYSDLNVTAEYLDIIVDDIKEDYKKVKW